MQVDTLSVRRYTTALSTKKINLQILVIFKITHTFYREVIVTKFYFLDFLLNESVCRVLLPEMKWETNEIQTYVFSRCKSELFPQHMTMIGARLSLRS